MTTIKKSALAFGLAIALAYLGIGLIVPYITTKSYTFDFQGAKGRIQSDDLVDKNLVIFFGYASCPDVCPTTIYDIKRAINQLEQNEQSKFYKNTKIIFVSIDPERDTPDHVQKYIEFFFKDSGIGAVATREDTDKIIESFGVYYAKDPIKQDTDPNQYTISHTANVFVLAKNLRLIQKVSPVSVKKLHEAFKVIL